MISVSMMDCVQAPKVGFTFGFGEQHRFQLEQTITTLFLKLRFTQQHLHAEIDSVGVALKCKRPKRQFES